MSLPVLAIPEFKLKLPSTGQDIKFRPFLVKEQKILYMAQEGTDPHDMIDAVKNIIGQCILTPDVNIEKLATFDIEHLFINLRAKSVGETVDLKFKHSASSECKHITEVTVDLEKVEIVSDPLHINPIMLTDTVGVKMRYPNFEMAEQSESDTTKTPAEITFEMMSKCVEVIFDGEEVYDSFTLTEISDWIEQLSTDQFKKLNQFFITMPKLSHTIIYTCTVCGQEETVELEGLQSFFTSA